MNYELKEFTLKELIAGYDPLSNEPKGYNGFLYLRPDYQRDYVYKYKQRDAVVQTVLAKGPLGIMYIAKRADGKYELIDGQQRLISIFNYLSNKNKYEGKYFGEYSKAERDEIFDYKIPVCVFDDLTANQKIDIIKLMNKLR